MFARSESRYFGFGYPTLTLRRILRRILRLSDWAQTASRRLLFRYPPNLKTREHCHQELVPFSPHHAAASRHNLLCFAVMTCYLSPPCVSSHSRLFPPFPITPFPPRLSFPFLHSITTAFSWTAQPCLLILFLK